jgi:NitT/TauT family transport system ATP-binding protein
MGVTAGAGPLLEFAGVSKVFVGQEGEKVTALSDVSWSLRGGEFVAVVGPSGCGKSTLLRLAAGLETPSAGRVSFRGTEVTGPGCGQGFVFQAYNAFPWLTVRQNVAFGLRKNGASCREEKIARWLEFTGLTEFAHQYPKILSGGMQQRLALARTMITEPELLLMDEPFGALDERTRENMQELLLRAVRELSCSVVLVTHDIREAVLLSDRVLLLRSRPGRIMREYTPVFSEPRSRKLLKSSSLNALYDEILEAFPA